MLTTLKSKTLFSRPRRNEDNLKIAKLLLDNNANVDAVEMHRSTALIKAASNGLYELAKLFIERKANVNVANSLKDTALIAASRSGNFEIVKLLLMSGADVNVIDRLGNSPLILAFKFILQNRTLQTNQSRIFDFVEPLCRNSVIINQSTSDGITALMLAAQLGDLKAVKILCFYGADFEMTDKKNRTAIDYATISAVGDFLKALKAVKDSWILDEQQFKNFVQWLPQEMIEDVLLLSVL